MKKALFPLIAMVLVLALMAPLAFFTFPAESALAMEDDPWVCLESLGPGEAVDLSSPYGSMWVGLFHLRVDGELHDGWCVDPEMPIDEGWCFNATLLDKPRETPWCEIGYIMANYSPDSNDEAAAIQLAIWKYVLGARDSITAITPPAVEARALVIYDAAVSECFVVPQQLMLIHPTDLGPEEQTIQETIILTTKPPVGGDVRPINKVALFAPWLGLALLLIGGVTWFTLRRRTI